MEHAIFHVTFISGLCWKCVFSCTLKAEIYKTGLYTQNIRIMHMHEVLLVNVKFWTNDSSGNSA